MINPWDTENPNHIKIEYISSEYFADDVSWDDDFPLSVSISGNYAVAGAPGSEFSKGSAYIFYLNGSIWSQQTKLMADDGIDGDHFGCDVSIYGDYAVIGAKADASHSTGFAYVFYRNGTAWSQQAKILASDGVNEDFFGFSVYIYEDMVIVGAYGDDDKGLKSGSAYIFYRSVTTWTEKAKLIASDGAADHMFGKEVAISENIAVVGAPGITGEIESETIPGYIYIYYRNEGGTDNWGQKKKLSLVDGIIGDKFGGSVSISDDYIAAVSHKTQGLNEPDIQVVYIFYRNEGGTDNWGQQAVLIDRTPDTTGCGGSVSIDGNYVLVGSSNSRNYLGDTSYDNQRACLFYLEGTEWSQSAVYYREEGVEGEGKFGSSAAISGNHAIIGVHQDEEGGPGSMFIFDYK